MPCRDPRPPGRSSRAFIAKDEGNLELKFALAALHQSQNDRKAAEEVFRSIVAKAGDSPEGIRAKGQLAALLLGAGDKPGAQDLINQVLAKDQRNEQGLLLKAGIAMDDRKLDEAIADLRTILRDVPNSARTLLLLAKVHEMAGSLELAQEHYQKAFQAGKQAPPFGMPYGEFLLKRNQFARAENIADDMLRATPGYLPAMKLLAQARIGKGDWVGAQAVADELRKQGDQQQAAEQIRGAVLAARKNYVESIAAFKRAYDASPSDVQPMVALVRTYLMAGKTNEAIAFLNSVVQASPNNTSARLLLGQLQVMKGDGAAATQSFQAVVTQQPKDPAGYVNLANLHVREKRFDEADKMVEQGLAAVPNDFSLRMTRAAIYELAGRLMMRSSFTSNSSRSVPMLM